MNSPWVVMISPLCRLNSFHFVHWWFRHCKFGYFVVKLVNGLAIFHPYSPTNIQDQILLFLFPTKGCDGERRNANRAEPKAPDLLEIYPDIQQQFQQVGWREFFHRRTNYHDVVALSFAQNFDGNRVEVSGISFSVTEQLISEATTLPIDGEQFFRSHVSAGVDVPLFFKEELMNHNWRDGVQRVWLQDKWNWFLKITQSFFTCEGRFNQVNLYHFHFLAHLASQVRMKTCLYLLEILMHMETHFRARTYTSSHYVYHKSIIKLLIQNQLAKVGKI